MLNEKVCKGDGYCFVYDDMSCNHKCKRIICPNHIVCGDKEGSYQFHMDTRRGVCADCFHKFGKPYENNPVYMKQEGSEPINIDNKVVKKSCKLDILEDKEKECCICMDIKKYHVKHLNCDHRICNDCFRRQYFGDDSRENEPKFPHPKYENEWYENEYDEYYCDEKFKNIDNPHPKENWPTWAKEIFEDVKKYDDDWGLWNDNRNEKYKNEKNLKICGLCRK